MNETDQIAQLRKELDETKERLRLLLVILIPPARRLGLLKEEDVRKLLK